MRWSELYHGLAIRNPADQPDPDPFGYFERMANGRIFFLDLFHNEDDGAGNSEAVFREDRPLNVMVLQARVTAESQEFELTCKTVGVLPSGIVQGTYVLKFVIGKYCGELPAEMFEDGEIPQDELSHWFGKQKDEGP